jgi:hypothetical protein
MSKAMQEYKNRVAELGCAICRRQGHPDSPACLHHARTGTGAGRRAPDTDIVPLCHEHHQGNSGLHGLGRKAFEREYGVTELELVAETQCLARLPKQLDAVK